MVLRDGGGAGDGYEPIGDDDDDNVMVTVNVAVEVMVAVVVATLSGGGTLHSTFFPSRS